MLRQCKKGLGFCNEMESDGDVEIRSKVVSLSTQNPLKKVASCHKS